MHGTQATAFVGLERWAYRTHVAALAAVALALICSACTDSAPAARGAAAPAPTAIPVVTQSARIEPLGIEIEAVGTARANESVEVTSKASNTVTAIRFQEGDQRAQRGAVLVELDGAEARAALAEAEAALAESRNQFKRSRDLHARQALSVVAARPDRGDAESQRGAGRRRAGAARGHHHSRAFDGRTGFRRVSVGSLVSPGTVITTLDDTSVIKLDFTVAETYMFVLAPGLPVTAPPRACPGASSTARSRHIDSRVDPGDALHRRARRDAERERRAAARHVHDGEAAGRGAPALLVPEGAIVPEQGKTFVFVVRGRRRRRARSAARQAASRRGGDRRRR